MKKKTQESENKEEKLSLIRHDCDNLFFYTHQP